MDWLLRKIETHARHSLKGSSRDFSLQVMLISKWSRAKDRKTAAVPLIQLFFFTKNSFYFQWFILVTTEVVIMDVDLSDSFSLSLSREKEDAVSRVSHLNLSLLLEGISSRKLLCLFPGLSCRPKECAYGPIFLFLFCRYSHSPSISLFTAPDWSSSHLQHLYLSDILLFSFLSDDSKSSLFLSLSLRTCLWFCPPPSHSVSSLCLRMYLRPMCFPFVVSWFPYIQSPFVTHDTWFCGVKILHFSSWSRVMLQRKESWRRETSCALSISLTMFPILPSKTDFIKEKESVTGEIEREGVCDKVDSRSASQRSQVS